MVRKEVPLHEKNRMDINCDWNHSSVNFHNAINVYNVMGFLILDIFSLFFSIQDFLLMW